MAILLCTYNGEEFLAEQLESFIRQTHSNWVLYVSDDGSADRTLEILGTYQARLGKERMVIFGGPQQGFARNFLSLAARSEIEADYFAFSDQDDIWHEDRLERGLRHAKGVPAELPFLYGSRTRLVDERGQPIGFSPLFSKQPSFHNALVQSLAGANTMLFNQATRGLLRRIPDEAHVVSHDWITYILVSGCEGKVVYDAQPTLDYRQHGGNLIGSNVSLADRLRRIGRMFSGTFRDWNRSNLNALRGVRPLFTARNRSVLQQFILARESALMPRLRLLRKAGLYRQTVLGNIGLVVAAGMRKI